MRPTLRRRVRFFRGKAGEEGRKGKGTKSEGLGSEWGLDS